MKKRFGKENNNLSKKGFTCTRNKPKYLNNEATSSINDFNVV